MNAETIMKKLFFVNENIMEARNRKDWKTYAEAVQEYTRLTKLLKAAE